MSSAISITSSSSNSSSSIRSSNSGSNSNSYSSSSSRSSSGSSKRKLLKTIISPEKTTKNNNNKNKSLFFHPEDQEDQEEDEILSTRSSTTEKDSLYSFDVGDNWSSRSHSPVHASPLQQQEPNLFLEECLTVQEQQEQEEQGNQYPLQEQQYQTSINLLKAIEKVTSLDLNHTSSSTISTPVSTPNTPTTTTTTPTTPPPTTTTKPTKSKSQKRKEKLAASRLQQNSNRPGTSTQQNRIQPFVQPMDLGQPSEYDYRNTNGLMKCLNTIAQLPTPEELSAKHLVIEELQRMVDEWLANLNLCSRTTTISAKRKTTATLLLGGSWHLKVGLFDSDLDIVTLLPLYVTSEMFFIQLYDFFKTKSNISKLVAMRKAAVPILSFQLNRVRIDLLFARYTKEIVPKNLSTSIHHDEILMGMDPNSIKSLSVPRVASLILELVPNGNVFRSCLRVVRLWAKRRGLYSNKAGFLGGISWSILVAFVCQLLPKATISATLHHFFSVLSSWQWPMPILISQPYEMATLPSIYQWCPQKNVHDRGHVMPIITPGFPATNSAVNVNPATLWILQQEFERGKMILDDMEQKNLSSPGGWQRLFTPSEFLVRYDHYLVVKLSATQEEELCEWSNYVASRMRKLVETLQHTSSILSVHPWPEMIQEQQPEGKNQEPLSPSTTTDNNEATTDNNEAAGSNNSSSMNDCVGYYLVAFELDPMQTAMTPSPPLPKSYASPPPPPPPSPCAFSAASSKLVAPFNVDKSPSIVSSSVNPVVRYFKAMELDSCKEKTPGMQVEIVYSKWQDLPCSLYPNGKIVAAGERARFILSKAHTHNVFLPPPMGKSLAFALV